MDKPEVVRVSDVDIDQDTNGRTLESVLPQNGRPWYTMPSLLRLNISIFFVTMAATTMGFDGSMMNGLMSLDSWFAFFNHPSNTILGLINASLFFGIPFAFPAAWLSDKIGRRFAMMIGVVMLLAGSAMQGAAQNTTTFIIARVIIGIGMEFAVVPAPVLISELAYPTHRGKVTSLYQTGFYLGAIASSWITFGTNSLDSDWSWRIPSIMQGFFPLVMLVGLFMVPESPRWLVSKGRNEEARAFLVKFHANGDAGHPLVGFEMDEIFTRIHAEKAISELGWRALWRTKADKKRLAIAICSAIIAQWSGNGIITYYLALVLDSVGIKSSFTKTLINGILQIFNFVAAIGGSLVVDRVGRRPLWLISCLGMLVCFTIFTGLSAGFVETQSNTIGILVIVFLFLYFLMYDIGVTPLTFAYPTEILPFYARQKGLAVTNFSNGLALLFNVFTNPIALGAIGWKYYIVYIAVLAVMSVVVYLFFAETKGCTLEEIADVFEGPLIVAVRTRRIHRDARDE